MLGANHGAPHRAANPSLVQACCRRLPPALAQLRQLRKLSVVDRPASRRPQVFTAAAGEREQGEPLLLPALQELQLLAPSTAVVAVLEGLAEQSLRGVTSLQVAVTDRQHLQVGSGAWGPGAASPERTCPAQMPTDSLPCAHP